MPPEPLPRQLDAMGELLSRMCAAVATALQHATVALLDGRERLAHQVVAGGGAVDALRAELDEIAGDALLFHAPVAGDLRAVVGAIRAADDAERMAVLARHVAEAAARGRGVPAEVHDDFADMGRVAVAMARKAADVARTRNVLLARELDADDDAMDAHHRHMFEVVMADGWRHGVPAAVDLTLLARYYERFADHAVLIAREIAYAVTGEVPSGPVSAESS